ncbi:hypothetical protein B0H14DRAFT_3699172 [Mycena olivaceomarginata]|nr:hypothetical protein B0H14DRAFT_3699172 [Mycena olivaceomarginata]
MFFLLVHGDIDAFFELPSTSPSCISVALVSPALQLTQHFSFATSSLPYSPSSSNPDSMPATEQTPHTSACGLPFPLPADVGFRAYRKTPWTSFTRSASGKIKCTRSRPGCLSCQYFRCVEGPPVLSAAPDAATAISRASVPAYTTTVLTPSPRRSNSRASPVQTCFCSPVLSTSTRGASPVATVAASARSAVDRVTTQVKTQVPTPVQPHPFIPAQPMPPPPVPVPAPNLIDEDTAPQPSVPAPPHPPNPELLRLHAEALIRGRLARARAFP